jgi:molybdate transport system substrate-binding protein
MNKGWRTFIAGNAMAILLLGNATGSIAAQIKVISGPATAGVLSQLGSQFERKTGDKITNKGGVTGVLKQLIESGEPFDLAIIPGALMDAFEKQGKIAAGTNIPFVRVGMGVAVRAGAAKPDISTVEKFKQTLLRAKSVTFVPQGETAAQLARIFDRLGIADPMKAKSHPLPTVDQAIASVASGENELYFALSNIIASAKGIELAGTFPAALQNYLIINLGLSAASAEPKDTRAFMKLLTSASTNRIITANGLERVSPARRPAH